MPVSGRNVPIAIVGMACRLPGADDLDEYWRLIVEGRSAIGDLPADRLDLNAYFDPRKGVPGKTYTRLGGIVRPRPLDAHLYPIPAEFSCPFEESVATMLDVAATACRDAHMDPFHMPPDKIGVYIGHARGSSLPSDLIYSTRIEEIAQHLLTIEPFDSWTREIRNSVLRRLTERVRAETPCRAAGGGPDVTGNAPARIISHALGLTGAYQVIDAACASSLFALSAAVRALRLGQMDAAIVGGASYSNWLSVVLFAQAQALSATGSFPFDSRADGFVSSDGYGAVIVKTLPKAIKDGDRIHAVVTSIGNSSDGRGRSLWAPRGEGQIAALQRAYGDRIDPRNLQYIEAHGTSTQLGDATEIQSITSAFGARLAGRPKIPVSSVKGNIGHTVEAAGIAGLIKTVLAMRNSVIPPSINFQNPNPAIDFEKVPFYVPTSVSEWSAANGSPRCAGVNSFGIGGLNAHVVVVEHNPSSSTSIAIRYPQDPPTDEGIAVVGIGGVFPGAHTVEAFRHFLKTRTSAITPALPERWESKLYYSEVSRSPFKTSTRLGGFVTGFSYDWRRHTIPPKQLETADPLRYLLLDAADQALADAGYPDRSFNRERTAVVVGSILASDFFSDLSLGLRLPKIEGDLRRTLEYGGVDPESADEVVAEFRDLFTQRNLTLRDETGSFSSSTLASNLTRTFDLKGGAFVIDSGEASSMAALDAARNLLLSGDCDMVLCAGAQRHMSIDAYEWYGMRGLLASDAGADNGCIIPGEAACLLILKRQSDARRDGDRIRAILKHVDLGKSADSAAGGGKPVAVDGPPVASLDCRAATLVGNTLGASGMVSVVEGIFSIEDQPLATGVAVCNSSLTGLTGRAILAPAGQTDAQHPQEDWRVVRLSAATLPELAARLDRARSETVSMFEMSALSRFTPSDSFRLAMACSSPDSLATICALAAKSILNEAARPALEEQGVFLWDSRRKPRVAVLFPGQGSQYEGMLRKLVAISPAAAAKKRELDALMDGLGLPTFSQMAWQPNADLAKNVWATQVSLFLADTIAFAALEEIGVRPDIVAGHSFGEYPALLAAGAWSVEEGIRVTHARCELILAKECKGALLATDAPPETVTRFLEDMVGAVNIANYNAPDQTVVGGDELSVNELDRRLAKEGFHNRMLPVPCPFHTPLMAPVREGLRALLDRTQLRPPTIPVLSSVTNRYVADPRDIRDNLVEQLTTPVNYLGLIRRLVDDGANIIIESGPRQVLSRLHRSILGPADSVTIVPVDNPKRPGREQIARITAALECAGAFSEETRREQRVSDQPLPSPSQNHAPILHFDATKRRRAAATRNQPAAAAQQEGEKSQLEGMELFLVDFICEQTGYPREVVHLDADLEADLGIDSLKKAQLFGELRERFNINIQSTGKVSLDDYPTLRHVLAFLETHLPEDMLTHSMPGSNAPGADQSKFAVASMGAAGEAAVTPEYSLALAPVAGAVKSPDARTRDEAETPSSRQASRESAPSSPPSDGRIMSRFVLRMREAPLDRQGGKATWTGAALVLGDNAIADTLRTRLTQAGVSVPNFPDCATLASLASELERIHSATPVHHVFLTQACDSSASRWLSAPDWQHRFDTGLLHPFVLCQTWMRLLTECGLPAHASLVSASFLGGDFGFSNDLTAPEGGAMAGLLKSIRREFQGIIVKALDFPAGEPADAIASAVFSELASGTPEVEIGYIRGRRTVVRAVPRPALAVSDRDIEHGSHWVVTGGARGITAGVARELGLRYGLRLFLLGSTPLSAASPDWLDLDSQSLTELKQKTFLSGKTKGAERWAAIQKGLEVHRHLRQLAVDGVEATYVCCDVGDRNALDRALNQVRLAGRPIRGIIHGAGIETACRFENKQLASVRSTFACKAGAAAALIALTETDPIGWFLTFGSVNGRFGGVCLFYNHE